MENGFCFLKNDSHSVDLPALLVIIRLVDADGIYPDPSFCSSLPQFQESMVKISADQDLSFIDENSHLMFSVTPDVGQSYVWTLGVLMVPKLQRQDVAFLEIEPDQPYFSLFSIQTSMHRSMDLGGAYFSNCPPSPSDCPLVISSPSQPLAHAMAHSTTTRPALDLRNNEIRILTLHLGTRKDPIRCSLHTARLEDDPPYEALSYAWGDPAICCPILLDKRVVQVTSNLESALRRLRYPDHDRELWVDALCINQQDNVEKSHQVNLMSEIYSKAQVGLLWLGGFEEDLTPPDRGLHRTSTIPRHKAERAYSVIRMLARGSHLPECFKDTDSTNDADDGYDALECLLDLSWWSRIWTVQEAVLPPETTVVCGKLWLPFAALAQANANIRKHWLQRCCVHEIQKSKKENLMHRFIRQIGGIEALRINSAPHGMIELFTKFRCQFASDPRDKIFALLGIVPRLVPGNILQSPIIAPDYSLDWRQVYLQATLRLVHATRSLRPLLNVREDDRDPLLPSWVPDLSAKVHSEYLDREIASGSCYDLFDASDDMHLEIRNSCETELSLLGRHADTILAVGKGTATGSLAEFAEDIVTWIEILGRTVDAFSSSMTFGMVDRHPAQPYDRVKPSDEYGNGQSWWTKNFGQDGVFPFRPNNKRFFMTESGLIGMGPWYTAVGDKVTILSGGRMPFILRRAERDGKADCYTYVGHAYVHGIMDGESVRDGFPNMILLIVEQRLFGFLNRGHVTKC
ncbi:heterokaryon incompatibility protein-domain-containing protein [Podospora aff. communis PSN243]|uniref:Heterokaryon incompatibility protein-domain-containing protein n=1 Tax=Podospora aff. communis PSN243 TaxID=3040156 RepID=A0AAV9GC78_9PEZI|nr:heterokaryon incompatibility protein-domain-containing protein [Podospora aff. communis PSN243]